MKNLFARIMSLVVTASTVLSVTVVNAYTRSKVTDSSYGELDDGTFSITNYNDSNDFDDGITNYKFIEPVTHVKEVPKGYVGIYNSEDLNNIRNDLNSNYILMNNIDLSDVSNWTPINDFFEVFDGNGYTISNLSINNNNGQIYTGLFGNTTKTSATVTKYAEIKNVNLENAYINSAKSNYVGSITAMGSVINCCVSSTIVAEPHYCVGGLVGFGVAEKSCFFGTVEGKFIDSNSNGFIGGIIGEGTVTLCYNKGDVYGQSSGWMYAGGITGKGSAYKCYNMGNVKATSTESSYTSYCGGIVGLLSRSVNNSFNAGTVTATSSEYAAVAGGICGNSVEGVIKNSYNIGELYCSTRYPYKGGIIGLGLDGTKISNCYYINTVSSAAGSGNVSSFVYTDGVVALDANDFYYQDSFPGLDFDTIWTMEGSENYLFPKLIDLLIFPNLPLISDENNYNYFGHIDQLPDIDGSTLMSIIIDGVEYPFSEEYLLSPHIWPYHYNNYQDQYYYAAYNLNDNGEITAFQSIQGINDELKEWDDKELIVHIGQCEIAPPGKNLPAGYYAVNEITKDTFPSDEITEWIGDCVRAYTIGDEIFKMIHVKYGNGTITGFDVLNTPQEVFIDDIAYPVLNDTELCENIKSNQSEKVVFTLYDGVIVNVTKFSDVISAKIYIGYGGNCIVKYVNGQYVREPLDKSNTISVKVANEIQSKYITELNNVYYRYVKSISELDLNVQNINVYSDSNMISLYGNAGSNIQKNLLPGESCGYKVEFSFNNNYIPYDREKALIMCSAEIACNSNNIQTIKNTVSLEVRYNKSPTSENHGNQTGNADISSKAEEVANMLKEIGNCVAWNTAIDDFLTSEQKQMIGYALYSAVNLANAPKKTFEEYVSDKVLTELYGNWKVPVGTFDFNVPVDIRVDTKKYGQLIIRFICRGSSYTLNDTPFGSLDVINYEVIGGSGSEYVPKDIKSGVAGVFANANVSAFSNAAYDLAMAELKSAFDLGYGNTLDEVADIIFGDTIVEPIINLLGYNSYKDAAWEILTYPSKQMYVKCPVNVYVFNENGEICASFVDGFITSNVSDISVETIGGEKIFIFYGNGVYSFKFLPTANGEMDIEIYEFSGPGRIMRYICYYDLGLELGNEYNGSMNMNYLDVATYLFNVSEKNILPDIDFLNVTDSGNNSDNDNYDFSNNNNSGNANISSDDTYYNDNNGSIVNNGNEAPDNIDDNVNNANFLVISIMVLTVAAIGLATLIIKKHR